MKTKDMTKGHPGALILKFALPLMAGNVFQELYTITDTAIVGQFLGVNALAAVGAGAWITWMLLSAVQGFTQGFSVPAAQEFGAGNEEAIRKNMANSLMISAIISLVLALCGQVILKPLLVLLNTPVEIMDDSLTYMRIYYLGAPAIVAYNYASCHLRALGNSSAPLRAMIIASVTNVVLDLIFVGPFGWGIAGAVIATIISQIVAAVYSFICLLKINEVKFSRNYFVPDVKLIKRLLYLGVPMLLQNVIISLGGLVVQFITNGIGIVFVAATTATGRLYSLLETAGISYGYAVTTYVGQNLGAGGIKRISRGIRWGNVVGVATSIVIGTALLTFGENILSLFIKEDSLNYAATLDVAYTYLKIMCTFLPVLYILHIYRCAISGLGNGTIPMYSGIAELVMRVGAALILPPLFGKMYLFYAEPIAWLGATVVLVTGYYVIFAKLKRGRKMQQSK